jgi:hypothetical protein
MRRLLILATLLVTFLASTITAEAAGPQLTVLTPPDGVVAGTTVTIQLQISGLKIVTSTVPLTQAGKDPAANVPGEGHIHYILDVRPLGIQYQNGPIVLTNVPVGTHNLMVELVNNDHSSLSPPVMQQITFQTVPATLPTSGGGGMAAVLSIQRLLPPATLVGILALMVLLGAGLIGRRRLG